MAPARVDVRRFEVRQESGFVRVTWVAQQEDGVRGYELMRKMAWVEDQYRPATTQLIPARGNGSEYQFLDEAVYKQGASDNIYYQLIAVYKDGARETLQERSATYVSTAVRRTWGSIKAMFQ